MSGDWKKRALRPGRAYYEGEIDGRSVIVTRRRDCLGRRYYRIEVENPQSDAPAGPCASRKAGMKAGALILCAAVFLCAVLVAAKGLFSGFTGFCR